MNLVKAVAGIEKETFDDCWSEAMIRSSLQYNYNHLLLVAEDGTVFAYKEPSDTENNIVLEDEAKKICGYLIYSCLAEEAELLRIAVKEDYRGRGYADRLFRMWFSVLEKQEEEKPKKILLEVRAKNEPANELYKKYGFAEIFIRRGYYRNPDDDARIMQYIYQ